MPRYFFQVMGNGHIFKDDVGRTFVRLEDAASHATVLARELAGDGAHYHGFAVCVIGENGMEVARVAIAACAR
jgi:hypothetical protein